MGLRSKEPEDFDRLLSGDPEAVDGTFRLGSHARGGSGGGSWNGPALCASASACALFGAGVCVWLILSPPAVGPQRGLAVQWQAPGSAENHPWNNPAPLITVPEASIDGDAPTFGAETNADIYFVGHGASSMGSNAGFSNTLNAKGVHQAQGARETLQKLGLSRAPAAKVQLAAAPGDSRGLDTVVIAAAPLWKAFDAAGAQAGPHRIQEVPALMEIDNSASHTALSGDQEFTGIGPVRWEHSALSGDLAAQAGVDGAKQFYETAEDRAAQNSDTKKPVEVRSGYQRIGHGGCSPAQMGELRRYITHSVHAGKEHIVLGTHGKMIPCIAKEFNLGSRIRTDTQGTFDLGVDDFPAAGVLHLKMHVPAAGGDPSFEVQKLHQSMFV